MAPTIRPNAEVVWIEIDDPKGIYRKQLVIVRSPIETTETWVLRVVGLGGESVVIAEFGCEIDGKRLSWEDLGMPIPKGSFSINERTTVDVPPDSFYLLGDNLSNSRDSREFGPFKGNEIVGEVVRIGK